MTEKTEAFIRGTAWPSGAGVPYPRADPADFARLPVDTWGMAMVPVGVRLEFTGDATAVDISYTTATDDLGYRGSGAGTTFAAWRNGSKVDEADAVLGESTVRLDTAAAESDDPDTDRVIVHIPEGMKPTITSITAVDGSIAPAPAQKRWLAYGDSINEGWVASGPSGAWPSIVGRRHGLDVVNLGYAGSARGEIVSAQQIAALDSPAVISIAHGTNCWTRIPYSTEMMSSTTEAFLCIVRAGHPGVPIVVLSPVTRPDAESVPNELGATLGDLRLAMERATRSLIEAGDVDLTLVPGRDVLAAELLADGIHPGDEGHRVLADAFGPVISAAAR